MVRHLSFALSVEKKLEQIACSFALMICYKLYIIRMHLNSLILRQFQLLFCRLQMHGLPGV